jgi:hypothetical protein
MALGVDSSREMMQFIGGKFIELQDISRITIHGNEILVSLVRASGAKNLSPVNSLTGVPQSVPRTYRHLNDIILT